MFLPGDGIAVTWASAAPFVGDTARIGAGKELAAGPGGEEPGRVLRGEPRTHQTRGAKEEAGGEPGAAGAAEPGGPAETALLRRCPRE